MVEQPQSKEEGDGWFGKLLDKMEAQGWKTCRRDIALDFMEWLHGPRYIGPDGKPEGWRVRLAREGELGLRQREAAACCGGNVA